MKLDAFMDSIRQTPVYFAVYQVKKWTTSTDYRVNVGDFLVYQPEAECFAHVTSKGTRLVMCPAGNLRFYGYLTSGEAKAVSRVQNG